MFSESIWASVLASYYRYSVNLRCLMFLLPEQQMWRKPHQRPLSSCQVESFLIISRAQLGGDRFVSCSTLPFQCSFLFPSKIFLITEYKCFGCSPQLRKHKSVASNHCSFKISSGQTLRCQQFLGAEDQFFHLTNWICLRKKSLLFSFITSWTNQIDFNTSIRITINWLVQR